MCRKGKWVAGQDKHDENNVTDLSEVGLRGDQRPSDFCWDEHHVSEAEKEGFQMRQEILVKYYVWFRKSYPIGFWLRS